LHINTFSGKFKQLQKLADIPPADQFGLRTLRKTLATALYEQSPAAAQFALGHAGADVTRMHYVDGRGIVARALDALPQPTAFLAK
jgi:integrase